MSRWWGCLLLLTLALPAPGGWLEELTPAPGAFAPLRPFHAHYKFGWSMLGAAEADFDYTRAKDGTSQIAVTARSTGAVRSMWRMDTQHTASMQVATFRPIAVTQVESYKSQTLTTTLHFSPEGVTRMRERKPPEAKPPKPREFLFPQVYDLHSALQFVRSQRLQPGDVYTLVAYPASSPYLAQVTVVGRQKVRALGQSWNALKLDLKLSKITDELELSQHQKFKRASAWFSDDGDRMLLRIESEIHVGSVWGEVDKLEWK